MRFPGNVCQKGGDRVERHEDGALGRIIERSRRIVFFGGAGVSTASGIPDFRSPGGLYSRTFDGLSPEMILSRSFFTLHPDRFFAFYRKYMICPEARPNAVHRWLFRLEQEDRLRGIVTQNVDGLHRAAGNLRVYELHGSVHENECMDCGASYPLSKITETDGVPRCDACGGIVKPSVVLYGEPLPYYVCIGAKREIASADTLIVAGTSLSVEPAASFIEGFRGDHLIVINREETPADRVADLVFHGDVIQVLTREGVLPLDS